jgi:MFS family permease
LIAGVYAWSLKLRAEADDEAGTSEQLRAPYSLRSNGTLLAVVACAACTSLAFGQLFAAYPLTLKRGFGHPEPVIGAAFALNTLLIVAFEMVLQHRLARCRPLLVMTGGCLMLALGYLLVQADPHLTAVFVAMSVLTLGEMLLYPVIESYVIGLVPKRAMSRAIGMLNATFAATLVVSPAIGTLLYEVWGYRFLWLSCAALTICAAAGFLAIETRSSLGERLQTTP